MKLIYENDIGRVVLRGGSDSVFNITDISGLSIPDVDAACVRYPGVAGQTVTQVTYLPRTITVAGDICDQRGTHTAQAAKVFSEAGTVYITNRRDTRKICCRTVRFEPEKSRGMYVPFTLQLIADCPYFEDLTESVRAVKTREKKLKSPFLLPMVFSVRKEQAAVINHGNVPLEPVIEIFAPNDAPCIKGILIENRTTGEKLVLNTKVLAGERLIIDVENRSVTGTMQGNLMHALSKQTPLSKFLLAKGRNELFVFAEDEEQPLTVSCRYRCKYIEAIL